MEQEGGRQVKGEREEENRHIKYLGKTKQNKDRSHEPRRKRAKGFTVCLSGGCGSHIYLPTCLMGRWKGRVGDCVEVKACMYVYSSGKMMVVVGKTHCLGLFTLE